MALVAAVALLQKARRDGYAVGAFNANNMEIVQAIVQAAEEESSPVILQASQGAIKYAGLDYIWAIARVAAENAKIPVAVHLDHGTDFGQVMQCIRIGFSSVMIDGSHLSLEENAALSRKVVEIGHSVGVSVEAELGRIGGTEDNVSVDQRDAFFTDPADAARFTAETGVDSLAVAIGTAHGRYHGEPRLDFPRLRRIASAVAIPLVLHGSSGVPDEAVREAVRLGISKVNIDTNIREAFVGGVTAVLAANPEEIDPRKILGPAREAMKEIVREKIRVFGSSGKAAY